MGASAITDAVSLVVIALIVGAETGDAGGAQLVLQIAAGFVVLGIYCFVVVPAVARWFFTGLGQERTLRYMLVFISLTSSAMVAELVGVDEPLRRRRHRHGLGDRGHRLGPQAAGLTRCLHRGRRPTILTRAIAVSSDSACHDNQASDPTTNSSVPTR